MDRSRVLEGLPADVQVGAAGQVHPRPSLRAGRRSSCPAIAILFALGVGPRRPAGRRSAYAIGGYLLWTLAEYWIHRVIFHFEPEDGFGARLHWMVHGVHHDHPNDPLRLVMPPAASVPLALVFYALFWLVLGADRAFAFGAGFLAGYLAYDMIHYHLHHHTPRTRVGQAGCGSCTCATTSRTTSAASGSARRTGIACSAPCTSAGDGRVCASWTMTTQKKSQDGEVVDGLPVVAEGRRRARAAPGRRVGPRRPGGRAGRHRLRRRRRDRRGRLAPPHQARRAQEAQAVRPARRDRRRRTRSWSTSTCCAAIERVPRRPRAEARRSSARSCARGGRSGSAPASLDGLTRRRGDGLRAAAARRRRAGRGRRRAATRASPRARRPTRPPRARGSRGCASRPASTTTCADVPRRASATTR